jgi:probable HAF family extracellular repeat protein
MRISGSRTLITAALAGAASLVLASAAAGAALATPASALARPAVLDVGRATPYGYGGRAVDVNDSGAVAGHEYVLPYSAASFVWRDGRLTVIPTSGTVAAVSNTGRVVGATETHYNHQAFSYANGRVTLLGYLGGDSRYPSGHQSYATAVNTLGLIVGYSTTDRGAYHAFSYAAGKMRDLGVPRGASDSQALAVNLSGQAAGFSTRPGGTHHATVWIAGRAIDLGTLGGANSYAVANNDLGQVVGYSETALGAVHAFSWRNGRMTDLGVAPGNTASSAVAVNNHGQVLVYSHGRAAARAYVWRDGRRTAVTGSGVPRGASIQPVAINERGQVAGTATLSTGAASAFRWSDGVATVLPGLTRRGATSASAINARGDVVGAATVNGGDTHAVIWPASAH